jgi:hypothetical protein
MPDNDNDPLPDLPVNLIGDLGFSDIDAAFNMRGWLQAACEAKGGRMTGGGFGGGVADIDIVLEGCEYHLTIQPIIRDATP